VPNLLGHLRFLLPVGAAVVCVVGVPAAAVGQTGVMCGFEAATIVGTAGDDILTGSSGNDVIAGLGGNDTIDGADGHDHLCGDDGNDSVTGGAGNDLIDDGPGDDRFDGGLGDGDTLSAYFAPAAVSISLGSGLAIGWGTETHFGFEGVEGSPFADTLTGDARDNYFYGVGGNDVIDGSAGFDWIDPGAGNDRVSGGTHFDWVSYWDSAPGPVRVNLALRTATGLGTDRLLSIEAAEGSRFGDRLVGNRLENWLWGYAGNDTLLGAGGNDNLNGGVGRDKLDGGPGRDRLNGGPGRDVCLNGERKRSCP
jgi:Ca2+-binding RTX toxin-like protein